MYVYNIHTYNTYTDEGYRINKNNVGIVRYESKRFFKVNIE